MNQFQLVNSYCYIAKNKDSIQIFEIKKCILLCSFLEVLYGKFLDVSLSEDKFLTRAAKHSW